MKGIKLFLGALAAASLLFSVSANAQENANRDENGKVVRGAYETNKAFDNTFIGIGVGANSILGKVLEPATWGKIGLAADLYVGKWWTPAIGMRAGYHGLWNVSKSSIGYPAVPAGNKFGFHYFHADALWNISNTIGGYKETRTWDFVPYFTMGVLSVSGSILNPLKNRNLEYAAGIGLINNIRISQRVDFNIDGGFLIAKGPAYVATPAFGTYVWFPYATVGFSFNLWKTNFDRHSSITPTVIPVPFTTEQYNALADKVAALEKENAELKDKVAALEQELAPFKNLVDGQTYLYENGTFTAVDVKAAPITLYFDCGKAVLSAREIAHLEYFIEKAVDNNTKLAIDGYADKQTGSAKRNQQLSEQRVKYVVNLLKKAGANVDNIETAAHGATIQLFKGAAKNRVVTVEVK